MDDNITSWPTFYGIVKFGELTQRVFTLGEILKFTHFPFVPFWTSEQFYIRA